jgi:hypothetical protein
MISKIYPAKNLSWSVLLLLPLLSPLLALAAPASYVWLEEPSQTNFPEVAPWDNLRGHRAPAITRSSDEDVIAIAYELDVPAPGGEFNVWGRTYDPSWSSSARWRVDGGAWQDWQPGPRVDRQVANKVFAMEWHRWGSLSLAPGGHKLELELTGPRPKGDIRFFVLDALLLVKGDFVPQGTLSPEELLAQELEVVDLKLQVLGDAGLGYREEVAAAVRLAQDEDLARGLDRFRTLNAEIDRSLESKALVERNQSARLSGRVDQAIVTGNTLKLDTQWSRPFEGNIWIGILQDEALYEVSVVSVPSGSKHTLTVALPAGLPVGTLSAVCVPIGAKLAKAAQEFFTSPAQPGQQVVKPSSWGIYRDNGLRAHPWSVTAGGMMMWDGEPYIPVGGMINTKLSWGSKAGDAGMARADILEAQLKLLKEHGIQDVFYNGFFLHSNPESLAVAVALSEKYGMRYGLHVTSSPAVELRSPGFELKDKFNLYDPFPVSKGADRATIKYLLPLDEYVRGGRCIWAVLTPAGEVLASGCGMPAMREIEAPEPPPGKTEKRITRLYETLTHELTLSVDFSGALPEDGTLVFLPEIRMARNNPSGFVDGIESYMKSLQEVYGSLTLGPGMRLWIDPFLNELHARNTQVSTSPTFQTRYAAALMERYDTIDNLNKAWAPQDRALPDFKTASRLIPFRSGEENTLWMDPETQVVYTLSAQPAESLHDLTAFKGALAEEMISRVSDTLKSIANVPVILKHNTFFSDWFVNPEKAGGQDGVGYEAYCYGDSLAYHNTLVPLAEALASARHQWRLVTETSPAAFDGQKDYVGYLDRLQMLNDLDLMTMFGAKGIYAFGFAFDPPLNFQVTELIRDPRQLEWIATYAKTLRAAEDKLSAYVPEVYGWYPVSLREKELTGDGLNRYEMDGQYLGTSGQIRMAPDGRWIIPAFNLDMGLEGYLVTWDFLSKAQRETLLDDKPDVPVWLLSDPGSSSVPKSWTSYPLDAFTASGIDVIPPAPKAMTLDDFRRDVLGYRVFQTEAINGQTLTDGSLMIWTCVEREKAVVRLPASAKIENLNGETIRGTSVGSGVVEVTLVQSPHEKLTGDLPTYLQHLPKGYYYEESPQSEVAIVRGVDVDELLALNPPAWQRWLPDGVALESVSAWLEAEDFEATTFGLPLIEGYSRYSGGAGIGINTHWNAPAGDEYSAEYTLDAATAFSRLWVRRMDHPAMDIEIYLDGHRVGRIPAEAALSDEWHLNAWNAGLATGNIKVGWASVPLENAYPAGRHTITLVALNGSADDREVDVALLGGQSENAMEKQAEEEGSKLMAMQIDALMLTR